MQREELIDYLASAYGTKPDFCFVKHPEIAVFRHYETNKWFLLLCPLAADKLGLRSDRVVTLVNLKVDPADISALLSIEGIYPAWHMNKDNWVSIDIEAIDPGLLFELIETSFSLCKKKGRPKKDLP